MQQDIWILKQKSASASICDSNLIDRWSVINTHDVRSVTVATRSSYHHRLITDDTSHLQTHAPSSADVSSLTWCKQNTYVTDMCVGSLNAQRSETSVKNSANLSIRERRSCMLLSSSMSWSNADHQMCRCCLWRLCRSLPLSSFHL